MRSAKWKIQIENLLIRQRKSLNWINQTGFLFTYSRTRKGAVRSRKWNYSHRNNIFFEENNIQNFGIFKFKQMMETFEVFYADKHTIWSSIMRVMWREWHCPGHRMAYSSPERLPKSQKQQIAHLAWR